MNPFYSTLSDNELIALLREGDEKITDYIMEKYKHLVRQRAGTMYILGADRDDLIQEGMIGLFKALRDYDYGRDASFVTFASLCISRQMYTAVEASRRKKHSPLNNYVSIEGAMDAGNSGTEGAGNGADRASLERTLLMKALASFSELSPEDIIIDRENERELIALIEEVLSTLERQVLDLCITGMDYMEIAKVLGREPKSIDNAIQRMRSKIRKNIKNKHIT